MPTQIATQRQAAAQRAAAARRRNAAGRTTSSAGQTSREGGRTAGQAGRTAAKRFDAATDRVGAIGRQAQRAFLIQLGAAATVTEKVRQTARTYTNLELVTREFDRFERRGARALSRRQRALSRQRREVGRDVRQAQRAVGRQVDGLRSDAEEFAAQLKRVV